MSFFNLVVNLLNVFLTVFKATVKYVKIGKDSHLLTFLLNNLNYYFLLILIFRVAQETEKQSKQTPTFHIVYIYNLAIFW